MKVGNWQNKMKQNCTCLEAFASLGIEGSGAFLAVQALEIQVWDRAIWRVGTETLMLSPTNLLILQESLPSTSAESLKYPFPGQA